MVDGAIVDVVVDDVGGRCGGGSTWVFDGAVIDGAVIDMAVDEVAVDDVRG